MTPEERKELRRQAMADLQAALDGDRSTFRAAWLLVILPFALIAAIGFAR